MNKENGTSCLGKVIRILSEKAIIIDVGSDYLTEGDKVRIYTASDEILDLDGNQLGVFENIKDTLDVVQTSENYSICKKLAEKATGTSILLQGLYNQKTVVAENINVDESQIDALDITDDKTIRLGDLVKKY